MVYWCMIRHAQEGEPAAEGRAGAGHARPARAQDPRPRSRARPHHRARDRATLGRRPPGRARLALPGAPPPGGPRMDRVVLGDLGEQPPGEIQPPDADGPEAARRADQPLGRPRARDRPRPAPRRGVAMGWSRFFRRRRWDAERARELQSYPELETEDNVARGLGPDEARRSGQRKLGDVMRIREEICLMNTIGLVETLWQD